MKHFAGVVYKAPSLFAEFKSTLDALCALSSDGNLGRVYCFIEVTGGVPSRIDAPTHAKYAGSECGPTVERNGHLHRRSIIDSNFKVCFRECVSSCFCCFRRCPFTRKLALRNKINAVSRWFGYSPACVPTKRRANINATPRDLPWRTRLPFFFG